VVVGAVGEATNATGLPTAARRSTQRFGDLTFGISLVHKIIVFEIVVLKVWILLHLPPAQLAVFFGDMVAFLHNFTVVQNT
jgi:hypothetical protein